MSCHKQFTTRCVYPPIPREIIIREAAHAMNMAVAEGGGYGHTYAVEEISAMFDAVIARIGKHIFSKHAVDMGKLGLMYGDCNGLHVVKRDYANHYDPTCVVQYDKPADNDCDCHDFEEHHEHHHSLDQPTIAKQDQTYCG